MKMLERVCQNAHQSQFLPDLYPARYEASQVRTQINSVQKEIGQLKKVCYDPVSDSSFTA